MSPTDEERREVAARLRELAAGNQGLLEPKRMGEVLAEAQKAMGTRGLASVAHVLERYADLIEPEERTCGAEQDYEAMEDGIPDCRIWRCECGEMFPFWRGMEPTYCPACGAKVVE